MKLYAVKFTDSETVGYKSEQVASEKYATAHRQWRFGLREEEPEYLGLVDWDENELFCVPVSTGTDIF